MQVKKECLHCFTYTKKAGDQHYKCAIPGTCPALSQKQKQPKPNVRNVTISVLQEDEVAMKAAIALLEKYGYAVCKKTDFVLESEI